MKTPGFLTHKVPTGAALLILAMVAVAGFGTAIAVSQTTLAGIFGDVTTVGDSLKVASTGITVQKSDAQAAGDTPGGAAELGLATPGAANGALRKAHWVYRVDLAESAPASVAGGTYRVELFVDDVSMGSLYVAQADADGAVAESAVLRWDLGADLPTGDTAYRVVISSL